MAAVLLRPLLAPLALLGVPRWWPAAVWFRLFLPAIGVHVLERGRLAARPALLAANHVSWLDIAALGTRLGGGFVSKAEVATWPLIGWFATGTGTVYLSRGAHQTQHTHAALRQRLRNGYSIAVFPEGTTTAHRLPHLFHSRLFAAAIDDGVPVQPVAIHYPPPRDDDRHEQHPVAPYIDAVSFLEHLLGVMANPRLTVEITYCQPIPAAGRDRRRLAEETREAICAALGAPGHAGRHALPPGRERRARARTG
ncbi:MAG TPA: lysophospholipid acyltransferase family protein [Nevskiales bacterium]|nr:lysophospholipid acyltransferase family protein [Nevskiales bacterium]